jgi:hypothetical protein
VGVNKLRVNAVQAQRLIKEDPRDGEHHKQRYHQLQGLREEDIVKCGAEGLIIAARADLARKRELLTEARSRVPAEESGAASGRGSRGREETPFTSNSGPSAPPSSGEELHSIDQVSSVITVSIIAASPCAPTQEELNEPLNGRTLSMPLQCLA